MSVDQMAVDEVACCQKKLMEVIYFFQKMNILASSECFSLPEHIIRIALVQSSVFVSFYLNVK